MIGKKDIESCFSTQLGWILDETIKEMVIEVWKKAVDIRGWDSLDEIPFTLLFPNSGRLTDHTKRITNLAKTICDHRDEHINLDFLIAGALLHDVGKILEYDRVDGKIVKSSYGEVFRHPVSGSKLAWQVGLPDEIVHIIYAHSHEGDKTKRSPEAIIVNHCDFIDFEIKKSLV